MREMTFLEKLAENLLEGGFIRALKPKLQPVQLAKALAKEMTSSQMVGPEGPLVANSYSVYVDPQDFAQFAGFQSNLERELAAYLRGYATRKGYRPIASVSVELKESGRLKPGQVSTKAAMVDPPPSAPVGSAPERNGRGVFPEPDLLRGTMEMPAVSSSPGASQPILPASGQPAAALIGPEGETIPLLRAITSVGRAVDNDVVLEAKSVSRRHAQIRWESGRYLLEDLGSTNGTFVSGRRVTRRAILDGEELSFGGAIFTFRQPSG